MRLDLAELEDDDLEVEPEVVRYIKQRLSSGLRAPGVPSYNRPASQYLSTYLLIIAMYEINLMEPVCLNETQMVTGLTYDGDPVPFPTRDLTDPLCAIGLLDYKAGSKGLIYYTPVLDPELQNHDYPK